jgi:hypothetical protein
MTRVPFVFLMSLVPCMPLLATSAILAASSHLQTVDECQLGRPETGPVAFATGPVVFACEQELGVRSSDPLPYGVEAFWHESSS